MKPGSRACVDNTPGATQLVPCGGRAATGTNRHGGSAHREIIIRRSVVDKSDEVTGQQRQGPAGPHRRSRPRARAAVSESVEPVAVAHLVRAACLQWLWRSLNDNLIPEAYDRARSPASPGPRRATHIMTRKRNLDSTAANSKKCQEKSRIWFL
jgi:hypothetical protein